MSKYSYIDDNFNIEPTNYDYIDKQNNIFNSNDNSNDKLNDNLSTNNQTKAYDFRDMLEEYSNENNAEQNMSTDINDISPEFFENNQAQHQTQQNSILPDQRINSINPRQMIQETYDDEIEKILQDNDLNDLNQLADPNDLNQLEETTENKINEETLDFLIYKKYKHLKRNMKKTNLLDIFIVVILFILKIIMMSLILSGCFLPKRYLISYILFLLLLLILNEINDNTCFISNKINEIMKCNTNIVEYKTIKKSMMILVIISILQYLFPDYSLYSLLVNFIKLTDENNIIDKTIIKNLDSKDFPKVAPEKFKIELNNEERINNLVILDTNY